MQANLDRFVRRARANRVGVVLGPLLAVVGVTAAIYAFREFTPVLSLGVLYLFAVLPVAVIWGRVAAVVVAVASMLAFNWFHLPPVHTFSMTDSENWFALAVYIAVAVVVADLATGSRRRAAEAEQREREAALLAGVATRLLSGADVASQTDAIAAEVGDVLGCAGARLDLGRRRDPPAGESPLELEAAGRFVGTLYVRESAAPNLAVRRRFLPALASLLAVAIDRERLAREALEANELRESDAIKTAVLRAVSHDLRSPLTAMRVAVDSLVSKTLDLDPADRADLFDALGIEMDRLERLVGDLLDLSRLEAGVARPQRERLTVDDLVAGALDELGRSAERVTVAGPAEPLPVSVDPGQIRRALVNLLENALRYSPPGAGVMVNVTHTRREAIVRVVDTGPGVDDDDMERIFEPFRGAQSASRGPGTGLGLAIARGFAEVNGGRVWAESRPGQGSTFALALPTAEDAAVEAPA